MPVERHDRNRQGAFDPLSNPDFEQIARLRLGQTGDEHQGGQSQQTNHDSHYVLLRVEYKLDFPHALKQPRV